jgi:hypothetical protein
MSYYTEILAKYEISDCKTFEDVKRKIPDASPAFLRKVLYLKGLTVSKDGKLRSTSRVQKIRKRGSIINRGITEDVSKIVAKFGALTEEERKLLYSLILKLVKRTREQKTLKITRTEIELFLSREKVILPPHLKTRFVNFLITAARSLLFGIKAELVQKLIKWALEKEIKKLRVSDVKMFLSENNIQFDNKSVQRLYQEAKLKYRYLPPWMRK